MLSLRGVCVVLLPLFGACGSIAANEGECNEPSADCAAVTAGSACRSVVCSAAKTCAVQVNAGSCYVAETDTCYSANTTSQIDACQVCDPSVTATSLIAKSCPTGQSCQAGACAPSGADATGDTEDADVVADVGPDLPSDVAEPTPDVAEPTPDVAEPTPDVAEPTPDVAEPTPDVAEPTPDVAEPTPDVAEPTPDVAEPTPDVAEPALDVAEPALDVAEPTPDVADDTADASGADAQSDVGPSAPQYLFTPRGLTSLGGAVPGSGSSFMLLDHRLELGTAGCGTSFCIVGGITP